MVATATMHGMSAADSSADYRFSKVPKRISIDSKEDRGLAAPRSIEKPASMDKSLSLRRMLLAPPSLRSSIFASRIIHPTLANPKGYATLSVTQPSFWKGMIPKPFRRSPTTTKKPKSKEWNPATFFIFIFLLIGSMSIQMIALRNEFAAFSRRADAKIGLLKEVIGRIQKGEDVDVEGLLGTGDARREKEWEEGI